MITHPLDKTPDSTQDAILLYLKKQGEMGVNELCDLVGITAMAIRRHLAALSSAGFVESRIVRQSRGRPSYRYRLSDKAESLFPSGFQNLAMDLLDAVFEQQGHVGIMELLKARNEKRANRLGERVKDKDLKSRVEEVARIFSEDGYMTEWKELADGNFFIFQRHCALHEIADQYRQVCVLEPQLMSSLLGVKVTREKYMLKNDLVCGYIVHADTDSDQVEETEVTA
ncbi:MAG: ArsR family transcriptional regulator [Candidatus Obscuribacterales bacterium]|nr:ArsR family transcriptional regulator [Candidatus Obscuribacterales bacterium]